MLQYFLHKKMARLLSYEIIWLYMVIRVGFHFFSFKDLISHDFCVLTYEYTNTVKIHYPSKSTKYTSSSSHLIQIQT